MREVPYFNKESIFCCAHKNPDKTNIDNVIKSNNVEGGEEFRALLDDELKMVNWILNSKAPETLETQSQDEIWVMGGCYFGEGGGERGVGACRDTLRGIQMGVWHADFLINACSKTSALRFPVSFSKMFAFQKKQKQKLDVVWMALQCEGCSVSAHFSISQQLIHW